MTKDYWGRVSAENDKDFEKVLEEQYFTHHYHPTNIPHYPDDPKAEGDANYNAALGDGLAKDGKGKHDANGLPGPVSSEPYIAGAGSGLSQTNPWIVFWSAIAFIVVMVLLLRSCGTISLPGF